MFQKKDFEGRITFTYQKVYHITSNHDLKKRTATLGNKTVRDLQAWYPNSKITTDENGTKGYFVIDVVPGIMQKIRPLFSNAKFVQSPGDYTHKTLQVYHSEEACRDILWLRDRFEIFIEEEAERILTEGSSEYERVKKLVKNILNQEKVVPRKPTEGFISIQGVEERPYQNVTLEMFMNVGPNFINADKMGLGKTIQSLLPLQFPENRPAVVFCPLNIIYQWQDFIETHYPSLKVFVVPQGSPKIPDGTDVVVISYTRVNKNEQMLMGFDSKYIIMDEIQELRRSESAKYESCFEVARGLKVMGLSGTPIFNLGEEAFNVFDIVKPGCLGEFSRFKEEWCHNGQVKNPVELHRFLVNKGLLIRRDYNETGISLEKPISSVITIGGDLESLENQKEADIAKALALSVIGKDALLKGGSIQEFNMKLRQVTAIAKAKSVAQFVIDLVQQGEKVVLGGWHLKFWELVTEEFRKKGITYAMITGEQKTAIAKYEQASKMKRGEVDVLCISLGSGAGIDGLQYNCRTVVIGELPWSKKIIEQLVFRVNRPGQTQVVLIYYLVTNAGSDPFIMNLLNIKEAQFKGIIDGVEDIEASLFDTDESVNENLVVKMAKEYLKSIGEVIEEEQDVYAPETLEVKRLLDKLIIPNSTEEVMQIALDKALKDHLLPHWTVHREYKFSKRSRLDFMLEHENGKKVIIECKKNYKNRRDAYDQVRRYSQETGIDDIFIVAPWSGVTSFTLEGINVIVVDINKTKLKS